MSFLVRGSSVLAAVGKRKGQEALFWSGLRPFLVPFLSVNEGESNPSGLWIQAWQSSSQLDYSHCNRKYLLGGLRSWWYWFALIYIIGLCFRRDTSTLLWIVLYAKKSCLKKMRLTGKLLFFSTVCFQWQVTDWSISFIYFCNILKKKSSVKSDNLALLLPLIPQSGI